MYHHLAMHNLSIQKKNSKKSKITTKKTPRACLLLRRPKSSKAHLRHHIIFFMLSLDAHILSVFRLHLGGVFSLAPLLLRVVTAFLALLLGLLFVFLLSYLQPLFKACDSVPVQLLLFLNIKRDAFVDLLRCGSPHFGLLAAVEQMLRRVQVFYVL